MITDIEIILLWQNEFFRLFLGIFLGFSILQSNAWYIVAVAALVYYIWNEYLSSKFNKWREEREIKRIAAIAKKGTFINLLQNFLKRYIILIIIS